jgi:diaminopimelate decarboxylase
LKITEETLKKMNVSLNDGKTYFFYDLNQVTENIFQIRKLFGGMNRIYFSVKANPNPTLLRHLNDLDVSFDVSSKHELETALACVTKENHITVSGPAKTDGFIGKIKNVGLGAVHLDSIEEYNILKSTAVPITVRWPLEVSYSQKVGIPTEDLQSIVKECANSGRLAGIHIYVGRERAEREVVDKQLSQIKNFVLNNKTAFKNRHCSGAADCRC